MGGVVKGITDFGDSVGDFFGFGETDAQQFAKDQAQYANKLARNQFVPLDKSIGFASGTGDYELNYRPFYSGNLSLTPGGFQGLNTYEQPITQSLNKYRLGVQDTMNNLRSNQNKYIQARVNPLLDNLERRRSELRSDLQRRGVFGSFGEMDKTNLEEMGNRAVADQRALATQETEAQMQGLQDQLFNAEQAVSTGAFARALEGLGLDIQTRNALQALASNLFTGSGSTAASTLGVGVASGRTAANLEANQQQTGLSTLGKVLAGGSEFFNKVG